jgi:steroid 5-alpha reductase family enzyme
MLFTILILIFTVIVVPFVALNFGTDPTLLQWEILNQMTYVVGGVIAYCFIVGELTKNNSQVDKLWSIVPIWYVWQMTFLGFQGYKGGFDERMILMAVLVTIWGIRLTYNFARRGAYVLKFWEGEEDYRWEELRKRPGFNNRFVWMLFNLFFISGYQNVLIFLFTLPILTALNADAGPLNYIDWLLAVFFVACVVIEYIADQQQYDFQTEKHRRIKNGEPLGEYAEGFVSKGLWSIVRHPNYAMEQTIWVVFYLFSVNATGEWINWSIPGSLLLIILFKGSSDFSEEISSKKYPKYKEYQSKTPRFIPFGNKIRLF